MDPTHRNSHVTMDLTSSAPLELNTPLHRRMSLDPTQSTGGPSRNIDSTAPLRKETKVQKVKRVVKNFFKAIADYFKRLLGINKKVKLSQSELARAANTELSTLRKPLARRVRPHQLRIAPPQDPGVAGPSAPPLPVLVEYRHPERQSGDPLLDATHQLADDVIDTLSLEFRKKYLQHYIPQVVTGAETFKNGTAYLIELLKTYLGKLDAIRASNRSENRLSLYNEDPFLLLFDLVEIVVGIRGTSSDPGEEELEQILNQYLLDDYSNKPAWLSGMLTEEAKAYIKPVIGWVVHSHHSDQGDSFITFMQNPDNESKYGLNPQLLKENYTRVLKELSDHIRQKLFNQFNHEGLTKLKPLLDPNLLIDSVDQLLNANLALIAERVIVRVVDISRKVNLSTLISHNFEHLQERIAGRHVPMDERGFYDIGTDIMDLVVPHDGQMLPLKKLWEDKILPEALQDMSLPSIMEIADKLTFGATKNLSSRLRKRMQERWERRILKGSHQLLSVGMSQLIKKAILTMQDGTFIDALLADQVLPMVMDQLIATFSKQVLSRNIDQNWMRNLRALSTLEMEDAANEPPNDGVTANPITELSLAWSYLMQNVGFTAFGQELRGHDYGHAKLLAIVMPMTIQLKDRLQKARQDKVTIGEEFDDDDIREALRVFFQPPANPHHTPDETEINAYNRFIKGILDESQLLSGWVTGKARGKVDALIDESTQEWIEAIPSTEEVLTMTVNALRKSWSTESDGEVRIDVDKVLSRFHSDAARAIMEDQSINELQRREQLQQLADAEQTLKADARIRRIGQISALLTDFIEKNIGAGGGILAKSASFFARKFVIHPQSLNTVITNIYANVLGNDDLRRAVIFSLFRTVVADAQAAVVAAPQRVD